MPKSLIYINSMRMCSWRLHTISLLPGMKVRQEPGRDVVGDLWHGRFAGFGPNLDQFGEVSVDECGGEAGDTLGFESAPKASLPPPYRIEGSP